MPVNLIKLVCIGEVQQYNCIAQSFYHRVLNQYPYHLKILSSSAGMDMLVTHSGGPGLAPGRVPGRYIDDTGYHGRDRTCVHHHVIRYASMSASPENGELSTGICIRRILPRSASEPGVIT